MNTEHRTDATRALGDWIRIGSCRIDLRSGAVHAPDGESRLTRKASAVLAALVATPGEVLTREALMRTVWGEHAPGDEVLSHAIKEIRRALGDDAKQPVFVETIPKGGYRVIAPVYRMSHDGPDVRMPAHDAHADVAAPATAAAQPTGARAPLRLWGVIAIGVAGLAVAAVSGGMARRPHGGAPGAAPFQVVVGGAHLETFDPRPERQPRISPDGRLLAYSAPAAPSGRARIFVRSLPGGKELDVGSGGAESYDEYWPVWYPDGRELAFVRQYREPARCVVVATPALGGDERVVTPCPTFVLDKFALEPGGFFVRSIRSPEDPESGTRIARIDARAKRHVLHPIEYARDRGEHDHEPKRSPDGTRYAFARGFPVSTLHVVPAGGGDVVTLLDAPAYLRGHDWLPDNRRLVVSADFGDGTRLYVVDVATRRWVDTGIADAQSPSVALDGTLVYEQRRQQRGLHRVDLVDPLAPIERIAASSGSDSAPSFATTRDDLAFVSDRAGFPAVWVVRPGGEARQVTQRLVGRVNELSWSPDDFHIAMSSYDGGRSRAFLLEPGRNLLAELPVEARAVSMVERRFAVANVRDGDHYRLAEVELDGGLRRWLADLASASAADTDENGRLLFTRTTADGLWTLGPDGAPERIAPVPPMVWSTAWGWRNGTLWYVEGRDGGYCLMRWTLAGGASCWRSLDLAFGGQLTVDARGRAAVITVVERDESDIGSARLSIR